MLDGPLDQMAPHKVDSWSSELLQGRESNMSLDILAFESIEMGGKIFVCSRNSSSGGDDEAVYIRLCLKEVLFGQLDLRNWQSEARQIPALALRPLVWLETQEIWLGSTCAQTESRGVWNNNTLVSFCGTAG